MEFCPGIVAVLRRLFSSFARGWPGAGLLLMRLVAAIALINQGILTAQDANPIRAAWLAVFGMGAGVLLVVGLWTPYAGASAALVQLFIAFSRIGDPWLCILLGTFGIALALIGPGAWSIDAHLFGWKRIEIPDRQS